MRIGTRWAFGTTPPANLPAEFLSALRDAEASAEADERTSVWTLTWLEGRPVAELDTGRRIALDDPDEDDDEALFPI